MIASIPLLPLLILGFLTQKTVKVHCLDMLCVLLARHGRWLIGGEEGTREMASDKRPKCLYSVWEFF